MWSASSNAQDGSGYLIKMGNCIRTIYLFCEL